MQSFSDSSLRIVYASYKQKILFTNNILLCTLGISKTNKPVHKCNQGCLFRWIQFLIPGSRDSSKEHFLILTSNQNRKFSCPLIRFQVSVL